MSFPGLLELLPHPQDGTPARRVAAAVDWSLEGDLLLRYVFDATAVPLPPPAPRVATDGLWRHTCCEAFVAGDDTPAYREFNFSPSGAWAGYRFSGYRAGGVNLALDDPGIVCESAPFITLTAQLDAAALPPGRRLRIGLTAVIEDLDGGLSYWSLRHPPGRPDFHHSDCLVLELERP
jgi:hypothetical protein